MLGTHQIFINNKRKRLTDLSLTKRSENAVF